MCRIQQIAGFFLAFFVLFNICFSQTIIKTDVPQTQSEVSEILGVPIEKLEPFITWHTNFPDANLYWVYKNSSKNLIENNYFVEDDIYGGIALIPSVNDPLINKQWNLEKINWIYTPHLYLPISVGILDTGISPNHRDLTGHILDTSYSIYISGFPVDDCWGHGTHVSGIMGALTNNYTGIAGVNDEIRFLAVQVLLGCAGPLGGVAQGLIYAVDHNVEVVNISLQYSGTLQVFNDAVEYAKNNNVIVIAASGNFYSNQLAYPARHPYIISVGATDIEDKRADFSNYGPDLEFVAPGVNVLSTIFYKSGNDPKNTGNGYDIKSGTSMAAPHVVGMVALIRNLRPDFTREQVTNILIYSCRDLGPIGKDEEYGWGMPQYSMILEYLPLCPADLNHDSYVDIVDWEVFMNHYIRPDNKADINFDGIIDMLDVIQFVDYFNQGCSK